MHANEVVSRDRLIDELSGASPPATAGGYSVASVATAATSGGPPAGGEDGRDLAEVVAPRMPRATIASGLAEAEDDRR